MVGIEYDVWTGSCEEKVEAEKIRILECDCHNGKTISTYDCYNYQ